ncbi:MAG: hypothetical protein RIR16_562 [Actinomycetota bacterium]
MNKFVVAIDGPAGSGKSSVSKAVAAQLGFGYLDTGAAYRALALGSQSDELLALDRLSAGNFAEVFQYSISLDPANYWVKLGPKDVTEEIRGTAVAEAVSSVAKIPAVREFMKKLTRQLIENSDYPGVVVEGRDITTVVFPDAQIRLLLTATEAVRLKRRSAELAQVSESSLAKQVSERDKADSQVVDFMNPADGVQLVDSSDLDFAQTVAAVRSAIGR